MEDEEETVFGGNDDDAGVDCRAAVDG